jgi:hypothetical protein
MPEIIHITFEKLTGLPGTIEGYFLTDFNDSMPNYHSPIVFESFRMFRNEFTFRQDCYLFILRPVSQTDVTNYLEHFYHGVNFMIKEWTVYGSGVGTGSKNPN